jgi:tRNA U34 5-methylaminomethyl-2-thiouridine-forming methyltransferase MnmC
MKQELIVTGDGSKTIYLPELDEHYHSSHGALQEAQHVFIKHGLTTQAGDYVTILEMGFGTGLNALLTYFATEKRHQYIHYIGIESEPIEQAIWEQMDYTAHSNDPDAPAVYAKMHTSTWDEGVVFNELFVLEKRKSTLEKTNLAAGSIDLIYYDAFGPRVQPELWTLAIFEQLYNWLTPGGILVTYCAKGQVKRDLKIAGFVVETLAGPPGKREMTRAKKPF